MNEIIQWDTNLFLKLNQMGVEFWDPFWLIMSATKVWIPLYVLLVILLVRSYKGHAIWITILIVFLNVFFTDFGSVWLFKEQIMRLRPCHVEELMGQIRLVKGSCGGRFGFVSSHASNTVGMAVLVGLLLRKRISFVIYALLIWAAVVGYSRIYLGVHYPLDVIFGSLYGAMCGAMCYFLFHTIIRRFELD